MKHLLYVPDYRSKFFNQLFPLPMVGRGSTCCWAFHQQWKAMDEINAHLDCYMCRNSIEEALPVIWEGHIIYMSLDYLCRGIYQFPYVGNESPMDIVIRYIQSYGGNAITIEEDND